jgi:hypothetical protein
MLIFKKINALFFSLSLLAVPLLVVAAGPLDQASKNLTNVNTGGNAGSTSSLPTLIGGIISVLLGSMGIIFVFFIVQAGILYMTAGGDSAKVDKAKKLITNAVIGLIIVVGAYAISSFVIGQIQGATESVESGP